MKCPRCGANIARGLAYCLSCGAAISEPKNELVGANEPEDYRAEESWQNRETTGENGYDWQVPPAQDPYLNSRMQTFTPPEQYSYGQNTPFQTGNSKKTLTTERKVALIIVLTACLGGCMAFANLYTRSLLKKQEHMTKVILDNGNGYVVMDGQENDNIYHAIPQEEGKNSVNEAGFNEPNEKIEEEYPAQAPEIKSISVGGETISWPLSYWKELMILGLETNTDVLVEELEPHAVSDVISFTSATGQIAKVYFYNPEDTAQEIWDGQVISVALRSNMTKGDISVGKVQTGITTAEDLRKYFGEPEEEKAEDNEYMGYMIYYDEAEENRIVYFLYENLVRAIQIDRTVF